MKFASSALQWDKFSIIGHSMGECSTSPLTVLATHPVGFSWIDSLFLCVVQEATLLEW